MHLPSTGVSAFCTLIHEECEAHKQAAGRCLALFKYCFPGGDVIAKQEVRVNEAIHAREVRVVDEEGGILGVLSVPEALRAAQERGLDLVEVSPASVPPVCRIMDYGKYKYQANKRAVEAKKKAARIDIKEVKLRPKTEEHDLLFKEKNARRFLEDGDKVKLTIMFRGREVTHPEFGTVLLEKIAEDLKDIGVVEAKPVMAGKSMSMVLAPTKTAGKQGASGTQPPKS